MSVGRRAPPEWLFSEQVCDYYLEPVPGAKIWLSDLSREYVEPHSGIPQSSRSWHNAPSSRYTSSFVDSVATASDTASINSDATWNTVFGRGMDDTQLTGDSNQTPCTVNRFWGRNMHRDSHLDDSKRGEVQSARHKQSAEAQDHQIEEALPSGHISEPGLSKNEETTTTASTSQNSQSSENQTQEPHIFNFPYPPLRGYEFIKNPRAFFKKGRVFITLWGEPHISPHSDSKMLHVKPRRFVVIRPKSTHCLCLPIHTYGEKGASKPGINKQDHAALVPAGRFVQYHAAEGSLSKDPIYLLIEDDTSQISPMSRINFGKIYTVEYNNQVRTIGRIVPEDLAKLEQYFLDSVGADRHVGSDPKRAVPWATNPASDSRRVIKRSKLRAETKALKPSGIT